MTLIQQKMQPAARAVEGQGEILNHAQRTRIKVLLYHHVLEHRQAAPSRYSVPLETFRSQLRALRRWGFNTITFEDYWRWVDFGEELPARPVIITFDDGYLDTYRVAFPAMQELGMRGVVFVLGDRRVTEACWEVRNGSGSRLMDDEKVCDLQGCGWEIGSHTGTHRALTSMHLEEAAAEIEGSKASLETVLGQRVCSFAYPYGLESPQIRRMVREAGYRIGCGVYTGPPCFGTDPYNVQRALVSGTAPPWHFAAYLRSPYAHYQWLRSKARCALGASATRAEGSGEGRQAGANGRAVLKAGDDRVSVRVVEREEQMLELRESWEALAGSSSGATIFQSFEWLWGWWKHLGQSPGRRLHVLSVHEGARLIGIGPFFVERSGIARMTLIHRLRLMGCGDARWRSCGLLHDDGPSDYLDIIAADGQEQRVCAAIAERLGSGEGAFDEVEMVNVRPEGVIFKALLPELSRGRIPAKIADGEPFSKILLPGSMAQFLGTLSGNSRRRWRQAMSAILEGAVSVSEVRDDASLGPAFDSLVELHQRRWNASGCPGLLRDEASRRFYREVAQACLAKGWLCLGTTHVDGRCIGARMGFFFNGHCYDYLSGFESNAAWSKVRPGLGLLSRMIEHAIDRGAHTVDLLRGDEPYKKDLKPIESRLVNVIVRVRPARARAALLGAARLLGCIGYLAGREKRTLGLWVGEYGLLHGGWAYMASRWGKAAGRLQRMVGRRRDRGQQASP